jgi:hypothetical protein
MPFLAGFYPVTVSYLSLFYTRYEFGRRLAIFYGQYAIAGALGGILSYLVFSQFNRESDANADRREQVDGWRSWQVLFLLEGVSTMIIALVGFFWLPRSAGTAWFLTAEERAWAEERVQKDRTVSDEVQSKTSRPDDEDELEGGADAEAHHLLSPSGAPSRNSRQYTDSQGLSLTDIIGAFLNPMIYYLLACNILSSIPVTAFAVFLPLVLKPLSPSSAIANLLTAPPYICGAIVLYIFTSWSDRHHEQLRPIIASLGILFAGLLAVVMIPDDSKGWAVPRYFSLCIMLSGTFIASPLTVSWISGNTPSPGKRALLLGINGWGNLAGLFSALIFAPRYGPSYHTSFWVATLCVAISAIGYFVFRIILIRVNGRRKQILQNWDEEDIQREQRDGKGPYRSRLIPAVLRFSIQTLTRWNFSKLSKMLEDIQDEGRQGDEKITFMYGL